MNPYDDTPPTWEGILALISTEDKRKCALLEQEISAMKTQLLDLQEQLRNGLLHCNQRIDDSLGDHNMPQKAKPSDHPREVLQPVDPNHVSEAFRSAIQGVLEAKQTAQQESSNDKVEAETSMAILRAPNCYGTPRVYDIAMIPEKHVRMQLLELILSVDSRSMTPWGYLKQCHERAATDHALMFGPREIPSDMSCGMYRTSDVPCCKPRLRGYDNPPNAASPLNSDNINHGGFWGEMELLATCEAIRSESTSIQSFSNCVNVIAARTLDSYEPRKRIDELLSFLDHTGLYTICLVGMELTVDDCLALAERLKMPHVYRRLKYLVLEDCSMYTGQIRSLAPHIPRTLIGLSLRRNFLHGHGTCAELFKRTPHKLMYVDLSETAIDGAEMDLVLSRISKVKQSMVATEFPLRELDVSHNDIRSVTKALPISLEAVNIGHNALSWPAWATLLQGMDGMSQLKELRMCTTCTELPSGTDGQGAIVADVKKLFSRLPPGLTILQMPYMQLGDTENLHLEFWNSVACMPNLYFLDVRECNILAMQNDQLNSVSLRYVDVSGNKLRSREAIVSTLQRQPNLEVLLLSDIDLKEHELHKLLQGDENMLPASVRILDLSWNDLSTCSAQSEFSFPDHLHWFDISGTNITVSVFNSFVRPLKRCTEMQFLDVSYNEMMSARGPIEKLAEAMNDWPRLLYLKFSGVTSGMSDMLHNITGDRGRSCLADAASEHYSPCSSPLMRKLVSTLQHDVAALLDALHRRTMHWTPPLPWIAEQDIRLISHLPASKETVSTLACMCFARFGYVMFNAECVHVFRDAVVGDVELGPIAVYGLRGLALSRSSELRSKFAKIFKEPLGDGLYKTLQSKFPARAHAWLCTVDNSISSCIPQNEVLGRDGAAILASIIAFMPSMDRLWCWGCQMTDDGIKALSRKLHRCFLKGVSIGKNDCSDDGLKYFAEAIKIHHDLWKVTLSENRFSSEGVSILSSALRNKESLTKFKYDGMDFDENTLRALFRICPVVIKPS